MNEFGENNQKETSDEGIENHVDSERSIDLMLEQRIIDIKNKIMPFYEKIEKLRSENPDREIGGRIWNDKIEFLDDSQCNDHSVVRGSYEDEREMAKNGALNFHSHPEKGFSQASAQDILSTYYCLNEIIFHENGVTLLMALNELPIEEIQKIDEQAWKEAEEESDGPYWTWKGKLERQLPLKIIEIPRVDS